MSEIVPEFDLFGGVYSLPPEMRLLERFSLRLSPSQKARFFFLRKRNDENAFGGFEGLCVVARG